MGKVNLLSSRHFFFVFFLFALISSSKDRRSRVFDYYFEIRKGQKCFGEYLLFVGVTVRQIIYLYLVVVKAALFRPFFRTGIKKKRGGGVRNTQ